MATENQEYTIPISSGNQRLDAQLKFTAEINKMTSVLRRTLLLDKSRCENDAEHSWHIAVMALLFEEYAKEKVDLRHAVEMLLVHDLIEIYAGDTFAYDTVANKSKKQREDDAAKRLFSILPDEQAEYIKSLWIEFDRGVTNEAKYANCMDKLQPFFHNIMTEGHTWRNAISGKRTTRAQVEKRMAVLADFMPEVYRWVQKTMDHAVRQGWLLEEEFSG